MFVNLKIPSFNELFRKFVFSFKARIIESDNSLVNGIVTSAIPLFSSIWAWWSDILVSHLRLILKYFIIVVCVCKCDVCFFLNYCINMDFESVKLWPIVTSNKIDSC